MSTPTQVYEHGDAAPPSEFTHTPEYQPQPGEVIAVRDGVDRDWLIRGFIGFNCGGALVECWGASTLVTYDWPQWSPILADQVVNGKPDVTFDSVVQTLLDAGVVRDVSYNARGCLYTFRCDASKKDLRDVLDNVELDRVRIAALAKLTPIERKALGL